MISKQKTFQSLKIVFILTNNKDTGEMTQKRHHCLHKHDMRAFITLRKKSITVTNIMVMGGSRGGGEAGVRTTPGK